jgi:DNA-binding transcriptional ArsR family regulator
MQMDIRSERLVVLQLLDREQTRAELARGLDLSPEAISRALGGLETAGVVINPQRGRVRLSPCTQHLDTLGLISV